MRKLYQIASIIVAAYMLALPVFFAFHSYEHLEKQDITHDFELTISDCDTNCILFQAYHSQTSVTVDNTTSLQPEGFVYSVTPDVEKPFVAFNVLFYLRGPPTV